MRQICSSTDQFDLEDCTVRFFPLSSTKVSTLLSRGFFADSFAAVTSDFALLTLLSTLVSATIWAFFRRITFFFAVTGVAYDEQVKIGDSSEALISSSIIRTSPLGKGSGLRKLIWKSRLSSPLLDACDEPLLIWESESDPESESVSDIAAVTVCSIDVWRYVHASCCAECRVLEVSKELFLVVILVSTPVISLSSSIYFLEVDVGSGVGKKESKIQKKFLEVFLQTPKLSNSQLHRVGIGPTVRMDGWCKLDFDSIRFDSIRFDSIWFDLIRFDSIRFVFNFIYYGEVDVWSVLNVYHLSTIVTRV